MQLPRIKTRRPWVRKCNDCVFQCMTCTLSMCFELEEYDEEEQRKDQTEPLVYNQSNISHTKNDSTISSSPPNYYLDPSMFQSNQKQPVINVTAPPAQIMPIASMNKSVLSDARKPTIVRRRPFKYLLGKMTEDKPDIRAMYELESLLGKGSTSMVRKAKRKEDGVEFACKSISKAKLHRAKDIQDMQKEIKVMYHLRGHPNIITLYDVYEDRHSVHLVMDLCTGGELFDHIISSGSYTEKDAANVMKTILTVIAHCHDMGVIHRDIKPENFLWTDSTFTTLKAIDFGLSSFFKPGQFFRDLVGSKYYVAPDVLRRSYNQTADIWSCGIIMYMLLTGYPPFIGDTLQETFDNIIKGQIDYESSPWPEISVYAKDIIKKMLVQQPRGRWTASQLLKHEWFTVEGAAPDRVINGLKERINNYAGMNRMQKIARKVIAESLPMEEIEGLTNLFKSMDADNSGNITAEELRDAVAEQGSKIPLEEFEEILKAADLDGNGTISYDEFLAATLSAANVAKEENLLRAFEHFDTDGSGYISRSELKEALKGYGIVENLEEILNQFDKDGNGEIDYEEFRRAITEM